MRDSPGIARLMSVAAVGWPNDFFIAMTVLELLLPFVYGYSQYRVSASEPRARVATSA